MAARQIYRVVFHNQGEIYEVYAKQVFQSDMYGFIEVEGFIFGERTQVVVDPSEEKLKAAFEGVKSSFIPMHSIIRIDHVEKEGKGKIMDAKGQNIAPFPMPPMPGK
ncbi:DUF1820 family protein [Kistimonas scapharcae]|uniref:DUF1820 family protein n=1 Tax=Kistimonas scapharcae TaxID=1036133 RepID=A0ABP8V5B0_9GAMM